MKSFAQTELMRDGVIERAPCARSAKMTQEGAIWVINVTEDLRGSSHQRNFLAYFPGRQGRHVPLASEQFFGAPLYLAYQWWNRVCLGTATNRFDKVPERLRRFLFNAAKVTSDHCGVTRDDIIS